MSSRRLHVTSTDVSRVADSYEDWLIKLSLYIISVSVASIARKMVYSRSWTMNHSLREAQKVNVPLKKVSPRI